MYNHLQEGRDLFRRTSDDSSRNNPRMKNNMMNAMTFFDVEPSRYEEVAKKKGKTSSRRMMSRMQY